MKSLLRISGCILLALTITACAQLANTPTHPPQSLPTDAPLPTVLPSTSTAMPAVPTATQPLQPAVSATAAPQTTATTVTTASLLATVSAQNVRMRQGPGTLFPMRVVLQQGAKLTVLGKAAGDDWLWADTGQQQGWVAAAYTSLADSADLAKLKIWDTVDAVVVPGAVVTNDGAPIRGIEFALAQGREKEPPDTRAHSMADGRFYLYLPAGASGKWTFTFTAVSCTSQIVDTACRYTGTMVPVLRDIDVPVKEPVAVIYFP